MSSQFNGGKDVFSKNGTGTIWYQFEKKRKLKHNELPIKTDKIKKTNKSKCWL